MTSSYLGPLPTHAPLVILRKQQVRGLGPLGPHAAHGRGLMISKSHSYAHIVTGWGKHNTDGQSKVKEAAWSLLTSDLGEPLKCWIPEDNVGVILVTTRDLYEWLLKGADLHACVPCLCGGAPGGSAKGSKARDAS